MGILCGGQVSKICLKTEVDMRLLVTFWLLQLNAREECLRKEEGLFWLIVLETRHPNLGGPISLMSEQAGGGQRGDHREQRDIGNSPCSHNQSLRRSTFWGQALSLSLLGPPPGHHHYMETINPLAIK